MRNNARKSRLLAPLSIIAYAMIVPYAAAEESLGRLFLTPERRNALEQQRQYNIKEQETVQGASISLDGVLVRSSGKKTVWINGQAQHDNNNSLGLNTGVAPGDAARAGISANGERQTNLRVGQTVNRATGEISDALKGGRVQVKPPSTRR